MCNKLKSFKIDWKYSAVVTANQLYNTLYNVIKNIKLFLSTSSALYLFDYLVPKKPSSPKTIVA